MKANQGEAGPGWTDAAIGAALEVNPATVARVRMRYVAAGLEAAVYRKPPARQYRRRLDGEQEARLVALACSPAAFARGGAGHNPATKKLEDAFKIALYVRSVSTDGCYPPAKQLAKKISQTKRGLKVHAAKGLGGVNRFNIVFVLKHGSNCNKVIMALRASSGLYILNSAQGTIRVQGRRGPRVVAGIPGPPRSLRLVS